MAGTELHCSVCVLAVYCHGQAQGLGGLHVAAWAEQGWERKGLNVAAWAEWGRGCHTDPVATGQF